jgi:acyl-CoA thioesterase-1
MNIVNGDERAAGMWRRGHVSPDWTGAQKLRRYGAVLALFNAVLFASAMPASARTPAILAFGDSLTSGYGLAPSGAFPSRLQAALKRQGIDVAITNGGVAGETTTDGLARLDWALADKPDLVILALGANDMLRGIDPAVVRANLDKMIARIQASGAKVLLLGMRAAPNLGADYQRRFDAVYPELAKAHDVPLYPFFLEGVAMIPDLNQPDGMHPNERGVAVMVEHIAPLVAKMIGAKMFGAPAAGAKS